MNLGIGIGQKLGGRYQIVSLLGAGGFGMTFVAEDQHLPGDNQCVVKQLKPQATDPITLQTARRLFDTEAKMLHQLGKHGQIPQLFAYFEENKEFYLVQELIEGGDLSQEFTPSTRLEEAEAIALLQDVLEILEFVHQQNVIHRDINPRNLIRRKKDGKLVLIDFGAVKQISTQVINGGNSSLTIAIGTPGYRPSEQANGNPRLSSDIYAVGILGIQALTGCLPTQLPTDPDTGEISWRNQASISPELANVLDKMVRYDFRQRYQSATEALQALKDLSTTTSATVALPVASPPKLVVAKPKSRPILYKAALAISVIGIGIAASVATVNWIRSANATDLYNRGETFLALKHYEDALNAYNRAVEIRPDYAEAWKGQGDTFLGLQRYEEALNAYDRAIQLRPDDLEAWTSRGQVLDNLQRYEGAIASFDAALEIQPDYLDAWTSRGNVQIKLQQYSEAIASFDKALSIEPNASLAWNRRGWALHNLQRYEEAVSSYDKAVEFKPDSAPSWYQRGNALINLQRNQDAVDSYQKAVQFQPNFYKAWYSLGSALSNLQRYDQAIAAYDQTLKFKPNDYEAWYGRGWAHHQLKRYREAIASYDKALQFQPKNAQAWYNRGNALYNQQRYNDAIASYRQAVALQPSHHEAWYSRGNALFNLERYKDAVTAYDQALRYKQDYREAIDARNRAQSQLEAARSEQKAQEQESRDQEEEKSSDDDN
jgi:tetratricopeptide (TPR) repeat protein